MKHFHNCPVCPHDKLFFQINPQILLTVVSPRREYPTHRLDNSHPHPLRGWGNITQKKYEKGNKKKGKM